LQVPIVVLSLAFGYKYFKEEDEEQLLHAVELEL
jgi:hypothetical protein